MTVYCLGLTPDCKPETCHLVDVICVDCRQVRYIGPDCEHALKGEVTIPMRKLWEGTWLCEECLEEAKRRRHHAQAGA